MTPELKIACEVVFQEHKVSVHPVKWNKDVFRGRISHGLSEMAKETLVSKNIIIIPNKSKKIITLLNPAVAEATSFEEAEEMIGNKVQALITAPNDRPAYFAHQVSSLDIVSSSYSHQLLPLTGKSQTGIARIKWYMKPIFYYVVWPFCAVVAGAAISWLIGFAYTKLFLD